MPSLFHWIQARADKFVRKIHGDFNRAARNVASYFGGMPLQHVHDPARSVLRKSRTLRSWRTGVTTPASPERRSHLVSDPWPSGNVIAPATLAAREI